MSFESVNPATGERLETFEALRQAALEKKLALSEETFGAYRHTSLERRAGWLEEAAVLLEEGRDAYARLMTIEMGKPIAGAEGEVEKCAWVCRHYAEHGARYLADEPVETEASRSLVRYRPLGPVLGIMPWNFPFWQVFRFAVPALMAGDVALLKHAPNVPQCALAIEGIFSRAGFPEGVFQNLFVEEAAVDEILSDVRVRGVAVTGSVAAGRAVATGAGRNLKKSVLELGGSDPFVVMPSADLDRALEVAVEARTQNSGQSCIAAKRFVVAEEIAEAFRQGIVERFDALEVGDPQKRSTDVGPLAREDLVERLSTQVDETVSAGARALCGGRRLEGEGYFYAPTVLDDVPEGSPARREELFGPVAPVFPVEDAESAIRLANDTAFGLGASVWTRDREERDLFVDGLEAGTVAVNGMVASDPRLPFGGVKASGYGRELGAHGIREFVNVQTLHEHA